MELENDTGYSWRQLSCLVLVMLLSPCLRLLLSASLDQAGRAAWLSPLIALGAGLLYLGFMGELLALRQPGEALPELVLRGLGPKLGRVVLLLFGLWTLIYSAFLLRSGAERLVVTIYPRSAAEFFIVIMGLCCLAAVLGSARSLVFAAGIFRSLLFGALALVFVFAAFTMDWGELWPLSSKDLLPAVKGSWPGIDILVMGIYALGFFCWPCGDGRELRRQGIALVFKLGLLMSMICAAVCGVFGHELASQLSSPFFAMVCDLVFFRSLERAEALAVMLWIFPDILLICLFLFVSQHCFRLSLGQDPRYRAKAFYDMSRGRYIIWLCCAAAMLLGLSLGRSSPSLALWGELLIPCANLLFALVLLPAVYLLLRLSRERQNKKDSSGS